MTRRLTKREKVMIAVLALLLMFMVYNQVVYKPVNAQLSSLEKTTLDVESSLQVETVKNTRLQLMKTQMANLAKTPNTTLTPMPTYDNSANVMKELSTILSLASEYDLSFSPLKEDGTLVRRTIGHDLHRRPRDS